MARRIEPKCRLCRREGEKLFLKGTRCFSPKCAMDRRNFIPGMHKMRGKLSDYGLQLREKQKMKKMYGVLERQFRFAFDKALRKKGVTGDYLVQTMERRLDNVVFRLLFAASRDEARQLVRHGHICVNGRKVDVPSCLVRSNDVIEVKAKEKVRVRVQNTLELLKDRTIPEWLSLDRTTLVARVVKLPSRAEIQIPIQEQSIVELYSK